VPLRDSRTFEDGGTFDISVSIACTGWDVGRVQGCGWIVLESIQTERSYIVEQSWGRNLRNRGMQE
jgi:hypothetical protein